MIKINPVETLSCICIYYYLFFLRKRVVSQGVFGIELADMIWAVLSSFRVNFYKVYRTIYC